MVPVSPYVAELEGFLLALKVTQTLFLIRVNHIAAAKCKGTGKCVGKTGHMESTKLT